MAVRINRRYDDDGWFEATEAKQQTEKFGIQHTQIETTTPQPLCSGALKYNLSDLC